jgi:hypothetical protein
MNDNLHDNMLDHMQWTKEHEDILKIWKAKAFAYLWLQNNSCYHYLLLQNWLAYTVIVLSSVSSAIMFSYMPLCYISIDIIQYIIGSLSLLSAILTGITRQLKPGEMYQQHATVSKRYHNWIRSIDACLSLTRTLRPNPVIFIEKAGAELDTLANSQVEPPLFVIRRFERIYGPLEKVLYGEDVVELWKLTYQTNKLEQKMKNNMHLAYQSEYNYSNFDIEQGKVPRETGFTEKRFSPQQEKHTFDEINVRCSLDDKSAPRKRNGSLDLSTPKDGDIKKKERLSISGGYLMSKFSEPFKTTITIPPT